MQMMWQISMPFRLFSVPLMHDFSIEQSCQLQLAVSRCQSWLGRAATSSTSYRFRCSEHFASVFGITQGNWFQMVSLMLQLYAVVTFAFLICSTCSDICSIFSETWIIMDLISSFRGQEYRFLCLGRNATERKAMCWAVQHNFDFIFNVHQYHLHLYDFEYHHRILPDSWKSRSTSVILLTFVCRNARALLRLRSLSNQCPTPAAFQVAVLPPLLVADRRCWEMSCSVPSFSGFCWSQTSDGNAQVQAISILLETVSPKW